MPPLHRCRACQRACSAPESHSAEAGVGGHMRHRFAISAIVCTGVLALSPVGARPQTANPGETVVLVTLDGARTQEIFGGLDLDILKSTLKEGQRLEDLPAYQR